MPEARGGPADTTPNKIALTRGRGRGRGPRALTGQDPGVAPRPDPAGLVPVVVRAFISRCLLCFPVPIGLGRERRLRPSLPTPDPTTTPPPRDTRRRLQPAAAVAGSHTPLRTPRLPCHAMPATRCPLFLPVSASAASRFHRCVYLLHKTSGHLGLQCSAADLQACAHLHCRAATASPATMQTAGFFSHRIFLFPGYCSTILCFFEKLIFLLYFLSNLHK